MAANLGDIVMVTNHDDTPLDLRWDGRDWPIPPGKTAMALFEAVTARLGNPYAGDAVQDGTTQFGVHYYVPSREEELQRIAVRYPGQPIPDVTIADQDGNQIVTPVHDPEGKLATPLNQQAPSAQDQINNLERQLQMLKNQVLSNTPDLSIPGVSPSTNAEDGADSVPTDE